MIPIQLIYMRNKLHLIIFLVGCTLLNKNVHAQLCNDIPIVVVDNQFTFEATDVISYGDSMISFQLTNNHATDFFAYPQAKLIPITPLPSGMTLAGVNLDWMVFASAWLVGATEPVKIYYDVTETVPVNYEVTFQLWLNNLSPVTDSCYFENNYIVNLNPETNPIQNIGNTTTVHVYPNPISAGDRICFDAGTSNPKKTTYILYNMVGDIIVSGTTNTNSFSTNGITNGYYFLQLNQENNLPFYTTIAIQ